jgi:hypothetical protein
LKNDGGAEDWRFSIPGAEEFAEKVSSDASGAEALSEKKDPIAALKALRHPKASFSANGKVLFQEPLSARLKPHPFKASPLSHTNL